jgi:UDP-glucose 4-epimerase
MARCLVTGAAGFIGSHLCDALLERGHEVIGIDDLSGGRFENIVDKDSFICIDVTQDDVVDVLFDRNQFDYIFHLAAYAAEGLSHHIRRFNYQNNLIGSVNLINAAVRHNVKGFIFTSSAAVYGDAIGPCHEDLTRPRPMDPYGIAKLAVEQDLECASRLWGLPYMIFRPHNVYGERQNCADPYRNVIGIFMRQALAVEPLTIFGDGEQSRAFTHVSDVAPVIAAAIDNPEAWGQIFNIGAKFSTTINELALEVQQAMGVARHTIHLPQRHEAHDVVCSHQKAKMLLGAVPQVTLREGLRKMAAWVRANPPQQPTPFAAIEVEKGLPPSWRMMCTQS